MKEKPHFAEREQERVVLDTEGAWEEIDKNTLLSMLSGTTFKIPHEPLPVRQLITRAEFAQEVTEEDVPHKYIGRKINRKVVRHPLSGKEYFVIKSNRGNSPQLFFSFPEQSSDFGRELTLEAPMSPEDVRIEKVSTFAELMKDERSVRLTRVVTGTNVKGKEHKQYNYLDDDNGKLSVHTIYREDAYHLGEEEEAPTDYVSHGVIVSKKDDSSGIISFVKIQSRDWNDNTIFVASKYEDGNLVQTIVKTVSLKDLPIFEETLRENPTALFGALEPESLNETQADQAKGSDKELLVIEDSSTLGEGGKISLQLPRLLDEAELLRSLADGTPLSWKRSLEIKKGKPLSESSSGREQGVYVDPEVDPDLDWTLVQLKRTFGPELCEVYFYGGIPRGYKSLSADIDILAVIEDKSELRRSVKDFAMDPDFQGGKLINDALGSYMSRSRLYPFRDIELHTISKKDFKRAPTLRLGEFLRNARQGWIQIYKRENEEQREILEK